MPWVNNISLSAALRNNLTQRDDLCKQKNGKLRKNIENFSVIGNAKAVEGCSDKLFAGIIIVRKI